MKFKDYLGLKGQLVAILTQWAEENDENIIYKKGQWRDTRCFGDDVANIVFDDMFDSYAMQLSIERGYHIGDE